MPEDAEHRELPRGVELLHEPALNKGTAFSEAERDALGLRGLLPPRVHTLAEQVARALENLRRKQSDLERYVFLVSLLDRNETLFYRLVVDHLEEMLPIIYTPTVGKACQEYGHILRRSRGLFITPEDRGRIAEILGNWPHPDVRAIVVTDGERILGLGDLGASGMGIPVGKLALYTACAGVPPGACLPVTLDVGTENESLLEDPLYIGLRRRRLRGEPYDALVEEFIEATQKVFREPLIQFEDFANRNAFRLLERYRERICTFDDDIQGTGSVTLAALLTALRVTGLPLTSQRLLFLGAGEAGIGIADQVVAALTIAGLPLAEARRCCWFLDSKGLVVDSRQDLAEHKQSYAHAHEFLPDLLSAVKTLRPTALIGVSGAPASFDRHVIAAMAERNARPIVFALSNPTTRSECTAEQAYVWSGGRALFASGSPFAEVDLAGRVLVPSQANNAYVFPGVALGVTACRARRVTDEMFEVAARILADRVTEAHLAEGRLLPPFAEIRETSAAVATGVAELAWERGLAAETQPDDTAAFVRAKMYEPVYRSYV